MSRPRSGYYSAIEYIGPRPQKPKRQNFFGGWVIVAIAVGAGIFFGKPLIGGAFAADKGPSGEDAEVIVSQLKDAGGFGNSLAAEALRYSGTPVSYDPAYYKIPSPGGDVPANKGVAADLVVRCYRKLGIDLQQEIQDDMARHFRVYPQLWAAQGPDANIDHRRVQNLHRFFSRKGQTLSTNSDPSGYKPGDVVVWALANAADMHVGIVVPGPVGSGDAPWIVHHPAGGGVKWEEAVFQYQILGHFRYPAE
ncbi:DUF1287 domain-containing protein [Akkermansiaceae bacterium]|nr:DUF1287 domain-containing protein [Akkermansiaceae bacterium]